MWAFTAKPPANMKTDGFALAAPNDAEHLWEVAASSGLSNRSAAE
jgi:hypothetical protein